MNFDGKSIKKLFALAQFYCRQFYCKRNSEEEKKSKKNNMIFCYADVLSSTVLISVKV